MADIAMLVADEELEKRLKRGAPGADEASKGQANFGVITKGWGSWVESAAAVAEPKTAVAMAAFSGFFSA